MKKIACVFVFIGLSTFAFSQKHSKDYLYLRNGAILKGSEITRDVETVKFLSAGNILVYKLSEIDSISQTKFKIDNFLYKAPYYFDCSIGVIAGGDGNGKRSPFMFHTTFNYLIFNKIYTGAGLGVEFWNESYMPVYLNANYLFREARFTPFIGFQAGYLVSLGDVASNPVYYYDSGFAPYNAITEADGGIMINPSFGFRSMTNPNFGWTFSFGYRYHQLKYKGEKEYSTEYNFNRLTLKIGIIFN